MISNTSRLTILICLLTVAFLPQATGQSAYQGGKGDGFDMATTEQAMVGMVKESSHQKLKIYPQPVPLNKALTLHLPANAGKAVSYRIYDPQGSVVQKGKPINRTKSLTLNLKPDHSPGVYFLELKVGEEEWHNRIVIVNE